MNSFETSSHLLASESIAPGKFHAVSTSWKQVGAICFCSADVRFLWIMYIQNKEKIVHCNKPTKIKVVQTQYIQELCGEVAANHGKLIWLKSR